MTTLLASKPSVQTSGPMSFDFGSGKFIPHQHPGLPVGQVVSYSDMANPRQEYVVIGDHLQPRNCTTAQPLVSLEDGHRSEISFAGGKPVGHWTIEPRVMDPGTMEAALAHAYAEGKRLAAEAKAEAEAEAERRDNLRAEWSKSFAWLDTVKPGQYASAALGSKNLKRELQRAFPGVAFSVRSDTFSGGDSIDVSWHLGPRTEEVNAIAKKYSEGSFDGMQDLYEYNGALWPKIFGGAKYVHCTRGTGRNGELDLVADALCKRWGLDVPADRSWWKCRRTGDDLDVGCSARVIILSRSYPAAATITGIEETGENGRLEEFLRCTFTVPAAPAANPDRVAITRTDENGQEFRAVAEPSTTGARVTINTQKAGVEIHFPGKPAASVLAQLKAAGWRWSRFSSCWYTRASDSALKFAEDLTGCKASGKLPEEPDRFDMQVEDNMRDACGC